MKAYMIFLPIFSTLMFAIAAILWALADNWFVAFCMFAGCMLTSYQFLREVIK